MNETNQKGLITESYCQLAFTELGIMLSKPISHDCRYDYIADINGKLIRIQCKTSHLKENGSSILFKTESIRGTTKETIERVYTEEEIDYFYTWYNGISYLVPVSECGTRFSLYIKEEITAQNKSALNIGKNYELNTILKRDFDYNAAIV